MAAGVWTRALDMGPKLANALPARIRLHSGGTSSWLHSPRLKTVAVAAFISATFLYLLLYSTRVSSASNRNFKQWGNGVQFPGDKGEDAHTADWTTKKHPIDDLILSARANYNRVLEKSSHNVAQAAKRYRERRGRHPPPGFDKWFEFAQNRSSVIVEDFFDRIYHDLNPYWALDPALLRFQSKAAEFVISVRDGNATYKTDNGRRVPWIQLWHGLVEDIAKDLPDVDIPVNMMDESRLVVPWEQINEFMEKARQEKTMTKPKDVISKFTGLAHFDANGSSPEMHYDPAFHGGQYWELAKRGCPPGSPSRNEPPWGPLEMYTALPQGQPEHSTEGYVSNWTLAKQICDKPWLRGLHGSFVEPVSISTTDQLIPMFGGSKLPMNNEILIPAATYLNDDPMYSGGSAHGSDWDGKEDRVLWRGVASGGRNKAENWIHFQRHRFVQMLNGTRVLQAEQTRIRPETFDLPDWRDYDLTSIRNGYLGDWVKGITDVAFVDLLCFPGTPDPHCPYTDPFFETRDGMSMSHMYSSKYLPDIDGNSFSGRYRAFLLSTSLPIKATIYNEWHDDRIFPWVHFVPMDNTFIDIYGILDYFVGYEGYGGHDQMARRIAEEGKAWAEKVLRREDMAVYTYRLLLEWARVCDDGRARLGWVGDIARGMVADWEERE